MSDSWQMNRSRVSAWRAEPAWMVVKPFTPDDSVSSSGSASRSRTSPTMATSGAMRRKPATSRRRSTAGRSAPRGAGLHAGDVRQRDVGLEHLLGDDDPQRRVELGRAARQQRRLARAGRAGEDDRQPGPHARREERGDLRRRACRARRARRGCGTATPVNLRMLTITWPPRLMSPCTMWSRAPSSSCASCRPSVGSSLRCDARRVVEDLGERPDDVVVVVEDLVVVAARRRGAASRRSASGALIMISHTSSSAEQRLERAVAGEVAEGPLGDERRGRRGRRAAGRACGRRSSVATSSSMRARSLRVAVAGRHVEGDVLGPRLHRPLDLDQRRHLGAAFTGSPPRSSVQGPSEPGATRVGLAPAPTGRGPDRWSTAWTAPTSGAVTLAGRRAPSRSSVVDRAALGDEERAR